MDLTKIKKSILTLNRFSAGSANDNNNMPLWIKGASLMPEQYNKLVSSIDSGYQFNIQNIEEFDNNTSGRLGDILMRNKSDKSTCHDYHHLYNYIFNDLGNSKLNILEIGLGTNDPKLVSTMGVHGRPGASLYAFREYLPDSNIYGADIDRKILFNADRIKTCYVDQLDISTFDNIKKEFGSIKYDLIIDDGLHSIGANFNTLLFALDNVNVNGWIVIEDIHIIDNWVTINYLISKNPMFKTYIIKAKGGYLYCIKKLAA